MKLRCVDCKDVVETDQPTVHGVPTRQWFAERGRRCTVCYTKSMSRATDPPTSKKGAQSVIGRSGSQRHKLLLAFSDGSEMTADEARVKADLAERSCYWKRVSELREAGAIEPTGAERVGDAGSPQMVCRITDFGALMLHLVSS